MGKTVFTQAVCLMQLLVQALHLFRFQRLTTLTLLLLFKVQALIQLTLSTVELF